MKKTSVDSKPKVLVADDSEELREIISFVIDSHFSVEIIPVASGQAAIDKINTTSDLRAIVSDYNMPNGTGGDVFKYLVKKGIDIPFILVSTVSPKDYPEFNVDRFLGYAVKPSYEKDLISWMQKALDYTPMALNKNDFCRVGIKLLSLSGQLPTDTYIQLSNSKFVKVFSKGDVFSKSELDKFSNKGVNALFIHHSDLSLFTVSVVKSIALTDHFKDEASKMAVIGMIEGLQQSMNSIASTLGYTSDLETLTLTNAELTLAYLKKNPFLADVLRKYSATNNDPQMAHCLLIPSIIKGLASLLGWDSDVTLHTLTIASLLHDVTLKDPQWSKYSTLTEFDQFNPLADQEIREQYISHSREASQLVKQFSQIPPDVETVIMQHHESPDGKGFPDGISGDQISSLSALFIAAHDIYNFSEKNGGALDLSEFVESKKNLYLTKPFDKILRAIILHDSRKSAGK